MGRRRTKQPKGALARQFGIRLARQRHARGLSQVELARRIRVYQTDISDMERGDRLPEIRNLIALAKALNGSADELLGLK